MARYGSVGNTNVVMSGYSGSWAAQIASSISSGLIIGWSAEVTIDQLDATAKADNGYHVSVEGRKQCTGEIRLHPDSAQPLSIAAGSSNPGVKLKLYDGSSDHGIAGLARLQSIGLQDVDYKNGSVPAVVYQFIYQGTFTVGTVT
jgi:hypothetical protein